MEIGIEGEQDDNFRVNFVEFGAPMNKVKERERERLGESQGKGDTEKQRLLRDEKRQKWDMRRKKNAGRADTRFLWKREKKELKKTEMNNNWHRRRAMAVERRATITQSHEKMRVRVVFIALFAYESDSESHRIPYYSENGIIQSFVSFLRFDGINLFSIVILGGNMLIGRYLHMSKCFVWIPLLFSLHFEHNDVPSKALTRCRCFHFVVFNRPR